jgi:DNA-binding transcriptional regulator LsrR (DeoR family)
MAKPFTSRQSLYGRPVAERGGFTYEELAAAVCGYFCDGHTPTEIRSMMQDRFQVELSREEPYRLLAFAAARGWLSSHPPSSPDLALALRDSFPSLQGVVAARGVSHSIASNVAKTLLDMVQKLWRNQKKEEIHVGFAGGGLLRRSAKFFAEMLQEPVADLPRTIVFHAMVPGFNVASPHTDPNAFSAYLVGEPPLQVQTKFVGLHAPGFVSQGDAKNLHEMGSIREVYKMAKDIDIIVTSAGGHWVQGHSALYHSYKHQSPDSLQQLTDAGCIGDMMWCPVGEGGPLDVQTDVRALTLMTLQELPAFIKAGKQVLLSLRHCGECGKPKTDLLQAILNYSEPLVTHLVVDSRAAREVLARNKR